MMLPAIQNFIINYYIYLLSFHFSLILIIFYLNFNKIKEQFDEITKRAWISVFLIFLFGLVLRFVAPHAHLVWFDELRHLNIAENALRFSKFSSCIFGSPYECFKHMTPPWPGGYHLLLSLVFMIFGVSESVAFNFSAFIGSFSIILVFLVAYLLFKKEEIGLWSALLFSLIPVHIKFSGTSTMGPTSLFFILLTVLLSLLYFKTGGRKMLLLVALVLGFAVQVRPENFLLIPLICLMFVFFRPKLKKRIADWKFYIPWIVVGILIIPNFMHISSGIGHVEGWELKASYFNKNIRENSVDNIIFWLDGKYNPIIYTLFAFIGLFYLKRNKNAVWFLSIWFLIFWILYSSFYNGNMRIITNSVRYSFNLYFSVALLCAYGISKLIQEIKKEKYRKILKIVFVLMLLLNLYFYVPYIYGYNKGGKEYRQYEFMISARETLPENCWIVTAGPVPIISSMRRKAIHINLDEQIEFKLKEGDCVLFFKEFWCYSKFKEKCDEFEREHGLFPVLKSEKTPYAFYNVSL